MVAGRLRPAASVGVAAQLKVAAANSLAAVGSADQHSALPVADRPGPALVIKAGRHFQLQAFLRDINRPFKRPVMPLCVAPAALPHQAEIVDRKSTRLNSS